MHVAFHSSDPLLVGDDTNSETDVFVRRRPHTPVPPPSASAVDPNRGPAAGAAPSPSRAAASAVPAVRFGSAPAPSVTVVNDSQQLSAGTPAGKGRVDVTVTTPGGQSPASAAAQFTYLARTHAGRATAVSATVRGTTTPVGDTGALNQAGGAKDASLASARVPELASASVADATTVGQVGATRSEASLADVEITAGRTTVTASLAMAHATATCSPALSSRARPRWRT